MHRTTNGAKVVDGSRLFELPRLEQAQYPPLKLCIGAPTERVPKLTLAWFIDE
jgi:hypothetical protein